MRGGAVVVWMLAGAGCLRVPPLPEDGTEATGTTTSDTNSTGHATTDATGGGPTSAGSSTSTRETGSTGPAACGQWWHCDWHARQVLEISGDTVTEDLVDVPVLVRLTAGTFDYDRAGADGEDLRVVSDGGEVLAHEVERWDETSESVVWVRLPLVGPSGTRAWIYYDNPGASSNEDPPAVWSNDYRAVWHLGDDLVDSTGNGYNCTTTSVATGPGFVGEARDFTAEDGALVCDHPGLDGLFVGGGTLTVWIQPQSGGDNGSGRVVDKASGTTPGGYNLATVTAQGVFFARGHDGGLGMWRTPDGSVSHGAWHTVAVTYAEGDASADPAIYVDGSQAEVVETSTPLGDPDPEVGLPFGIGDHLPNAARSYDGFIDELRLSSVIRSPDWIRFGAASVGGDAVALGALEVR